MKNSIFLLIALFIFACSDDDSPVVQSNELNGTFVLTNIICFCGFPDPPEFERTQLTIDMANNQIIVERSGNGLEYFRPVGTYTFQESENTITFEDGQSYTYTIENNMLTLNFVDEPLIADDEITYSFRRN